MLSSRPCWAALRPGMRCTQGCRRSRRQAHAWSRESRAPAMRARVRGRPRKDGPPGPTCHRRAALRLRGERRVEPQAALLHLPGVPPAPAAAGAAAGEFKRVPLRRQLLCKPAASGEVGGKGVVASVIRWAPLAVAALAHALACAGRRALAVACVARRAQELGWECAAHAGRVRMGRTRRMCQVACELSCGPHAAGHAHADHMRRFHARMLTLAACGRALGRPPQKAPACPASPRRC